MRMAMHGDFECLLDDDGVKQTQKKQGTTQGRTPGFKDSNLNNLVTSDQTTRRKLEFDSE